MENIDKVMLVVSIAFIFFSIPTIIGLFLFSIVLRTLTTNETGINFYNTNFYDLKNMVISAPTLFFLIVFTITFWLYLSLFVITLVSISKRKNPTYWAALTSLGFFLPPLGIIILCAYWTTGKRRIIKEIPPTQQTQIQSPP